MTKNVVYFITVGRPPFDAVKIGYTTDLTKRLYQYSTCNPHGAQLLGSAPGGPNTEALLLRKFAPYRLRGEWFELTDASRALIETVLLDGIPDLDVGESVVRLFPEMARPASLRAPRGNSEMVAADARLVLECAGPGPAGESRKDALTRAAINAGLGYARVVAFFYGKGNPPTEARRQLEACAIRMRSVAA